MNGGEEIRSERLATDPDTSKLDTGVPYPDAAPEVVVRVQLAWQGVRCAWLEEASFRRQTYGAVAMFGLLALLRPAPVWWGLCLLATLMVLALELLNSALERLTDHVHPTQHHAVKILKDMAGGAVVMGNVGMAVVGLGAILTSTGVFAS